MTAPPRPSRRTAGFSMIELLTALVLMGLIASMAAPRMEAFITRQKTRRSLDRVAGDISHARLMAVQDGRRVWLRFNANGTYTMEAVDPSGQIIPLKSVDLRQDARAVTLAGLTQLEFSSRGLVANLSGTSESFLKVVTPAHRDSLFVSPAGRVYRAY